jgi:RNA polymerase sigma-70 factor (ECF subfamily)
MEDSEIVALYFAREEAALDATQKKYEDYLHKIAYNILQDLQDSQESVNDTYLAAWNSIPPNRPTVLATYLGKLTRRIAIDILRKRNRLKRRNSEYAVSLAELEDCIAGGEMPEDVVQAQLLGECISAFVRQLPEQSRHVFVGRYYFLDSVKDIARYCGISEAKVKTLLYRMRGNLRLYLEKEGFTV